MSFGLQNSVLALTPTNRIDSAFPDGADGSGVVPSWITASAPDLSSLAVGTAFSVDLAESGFFIDPGSPSSELGFNYVSGQPALAAGFSFSGTVLSNPCTVATVGAFRLVAVRNGVSVLSPILTFSINSAVGVDDVAPSIPTGITATSGPNVGQVTITFDTPCDVAPANASASGAAHVDLLINSAVTTPPSPIVTGSNALAPPTSVNIGSITSPDVPAFLQSDSVWTLSAAGTGIATVTADQCLFGDFGTKTGKQRFVARLSAYTSTAGTALVGLMIRESTAANSKYVALGLRPSNGTPGLFVETRTTTGGTSAQVASLTKDGNGVTITFGYVKIERAADNQTWTFAYSPDQRGWTIITTQVLSMTAAVRDGLFATSQSAGTAITAIVDEVAITDAATLSTTLTVAQAVAIQLRSVDAGGNISALSTAIQGIPKAQTGGNTGKLKFNPSVAYLQIDYNLSLSQQFAQMATLKASCPQARGFHVLWQPSFFENPALVGGAAQYDGSWNFANDQTNINNLRGFALWDKFLAGATALGCQLMVSMRCLGGHSNPGAQSATSFPSFFPAYWGNSTYGPNTAATNGRWGAVWINCFTANNGSQFAFYFRWWDPIISPLIKAIGAAYGPRYDSNQNLEAVSWGADELIADVATGITEAGYIQTVLGPSGLNQSWRDSFPTTIVRSFTSYLQTGNMDTAFADGLPRKIAIGGPDTCNDSPYTSGDPTLNSDGRYRAITAAWRWKGLTASKGGGGVQDATAPIYVGKGCYICEVEGEDTAYDANTSTIYNGNGRALGDGVLQHIVMEANLLGSSHMVWYAAPAVPTSFTPRPGFPVSVYPTGPHPNLCDFLSSAAQGGGVSVNGITAGVSLTNTTYPTGWLQ